jgi:hypothetical protein
MYEVSCSGLQLRQSMSAIMRSPTYSVLDLYHLLRNAPDFLHREDCSRFLLDEQPTSIHRARTFLPFGLQPCSHSADFVRKFAGM